MGDNSRKDEQLFNKVIKRLQGGSKETQDLQSMKLFLDAISQKLKSKDIGLGDLKHQLKEAKLSSKEIEQLYYESVGKRKSIGAINDQVDEAKIILFQLVSSNYEFFHSILSQNRKFVEAFKEIRSYTEDVEFAGILDEIFVEYQKVQSLLNYVVQKNTKQTSQPDYNDYQFDNDESQIFFKKLLQLYKALKDSQFPNPKLLKMYMDKMGSEMTSKTPNEKRVKQLLKLLKNVPLLIDTKVDPYQFQKLLQNIYQFIYMVSEPSQRKVFNTKLSILLQKAMDRYQQKSGDKETLGNKNTQQRSIFSQMRKQSYAKDQRVQIFKYKMNSFYVRIIKQFFLMIDEKNLKNLSGIDSEIKPILVDLHEIYEQLMESDDSNLQDLVNRISKGYQDNTIEYEGILYRFKFIIQKLKEVKSQIKHTYFTDVVQELINIIEQQYKYLFSVIKRKDLENNTEAIMEETEDALTGQGSEYFDDLDDDTIEKQRLENSNYLQTLQNFIAVLQMRSNIQRTKRELATINEKHYYEDLTLEALKGMHDQCKNYYSDIEKFFDTEKEKKSAVFDPILSQYMYHVALRFQSSSYISDGYSTNQLVNPRYFLQGTTTMGELINPSIYEHQKFAPNASDEQNQQKYEYNHSYAKWYFSSKFLGITEEIDAKHQKFPNKSKECTDIKIPVIPLKLQQKCTLLKDSTIQNGVSLKIYENMVKYGNLYDLLSMNPDISTVHSKQLRQFSDLFNLGLQEETSKVTEDVQKYTVATSNPYMVLRFEKPAILGRLLNLSENTVRWNKDIDHLLIKQLDAIMQQIQENSVIQKDKLRVTSFKNDILKEYLIPEVQIPFIPVVLSDAVIQCDYAENNTQYKQTYSILPKQIHDISLNQEEHCLEKQRALEDQYGEQSEYHDLYHKDSLMLFNAIKPDQYELQGDYIRKAQKDLFSDKDRKCQRLLFDDLPENNEIIHKIGEKDDLFNLYTITPMMGEQYVAPIWSNNKSQVGFQISEYSNKNDFWANMDLLHNNINKHMNCFFDTTNLVEARLKYTDFERRNCIFYDITQSADPDAMNPNNEVYKDKVNTFMEYQLHMAQHLQYHIANGSKLIFDPLIRKQLFKTATNIYRGLPIVAGQDRNIYTGRNGLQEIADVFAAPDDNDRKETRYSFVIAQTDDKDITWDLFEPQVWYKDDNHAHIVQNQAYITFGRTFGLPSRQLNTYSKILGSNTGNMIMKNGVIKGNDNQLDVGADLYLDYTNMLRTDDPLAEIFEIINKGNGDMVKQIGLGPYYSRYSHVQQMQKGLYEIPEEYLSKQPRISMGIVLRDTPDMTVKFAFIEACQKKDQTMIKCNVLKVNHKQYEQLQEILEDQNTGFREYLSQCIKLQYFSNHEVLIHTKQMTLKSDVKESFKQEDFSKLVKKVLKIKRRGFTGLLALAEGVDVYLGAVVTNIVNMDVKFEDIKSMIGDLFISYRKETDITQKEALKDFGSSKYLNANQHLHLFSTSSIFNGIFKRDNRKKLFGGARIPNPKLYEYDIEGYYTELTTYIEDMKKKINEDTTINNFVKIFSLVCKGIHQNSNQSLSEEHIRKYIKNYLLASCIEINDSAMEFDFGVSLEQAIATGDKKQYQLAFDMSEDKKTKLIGIDAIYVPQNWNLSDSYEDTALVAHGTTECTQELDILYNNILNAMGQKLVSVLGLYRIQVKKKNDLQITRLLTGAGKKNKLNRSHSTDIKALDSLKLENITRHIVKGVQDFDMKKFELYYRTILICKYYHQLFNIQQQQGNVLLKFKPENDKVEGDLLKLFMDKHDQQETIVYTPHIIELLISRIDAIYDQQNKHSHSVYNAIVEYVNKNYGIVTKKDQEKIKEMDEKQRTLSITNKPFIDIDNEDDDDFSVTSRLGTLAQEELQKVDVEQIDLLATKDLIEQQIDSLWTIIKGNNDIDKSLTRLFRGLSYELKEAQRDKKIYKLVSLLNSSNHYREKQDYAIIVHEQITFGISIINQFTALITLFTSTKSQLDENKSDEFIQLHSILSDDNLTNLIPQTKDKQLQFSVGSENLQIYLKALLNTLKSNIILHKKYYFEGDDMEAPKHGMPTIQQLTEQVQEIIDFFVSMRIKEGFQRRLKGGNNVDEAIEYYQKGGHERETNDQDFNVNGRVLYAEVDNSEAELEERQKHDLEILDDFGEYVSAPKKELKKEPKKEDTKEDPLIITLMDNMIGYKGIQKKFKFNPLAQIGDLKLGQQATNWVQIGSFDGLVNQITDKAQVIIPNKLIKSIIIKTNIQVHGSVISYSNQDYLVLQKMAEKYGIPKDKLVIMQVYSDSIYLQVKYKQNKNQIIPQTNTVLDQYVQANFTNKLRGGALKEDQQAKTFKSVNRQFNGYNTYNLFDNHHNDVYVFNKVIKELIKNTEVLSLVPKVFHKIFAGIWGYDGNTMDAEIIRQYKVVHSTQRSKKELQNILTKYNLHGRVDRPNIHDTQSMKRNDKDPVGGVWDYSQDRPIQQAQKVNRLINPVHSEELLEGVLYDGFGEMDEITVQEILMHNYDNMSKLRTFFTSSVLNFCGNLLASQQSLLTERGKYDGNSDASDVMTLEQNTEKQLVCACIEAVLQFHCLLNKLSLKQRTLDHLINKIYNNSEQEAQKDELIELNRKLMHTQQLRDTILRVKMRLDDFIQTKQSFIPKLLSDSLESTNAKPLYSNLYYLIDIENIHQNIVQQNNNLDQYVFARYKYNRLLVDTKDSDDLIKEFSKSIQPEFIARTDPLIWFLVQAKIQLKNGIINREGVQQEYFFKYPKFSEMLLQELPPIVHKDYIAPHWITTDLKSHDKQVAYLTKIRDSLYGKEYEHNSDYENMGDIDDEYDNKDPKTQMQDFSIRIQQTVNALVDYTALVSSIDRQLPIQAQKSMLLRQTLPQKNVDIIDQIIQKVIGTKQRDISTIEQHNFIDLGIVPLNLNMLKKDVNLFNIAFNSSLYKKFLTTFKSLVSADFFDKLEVAAQKQLGITSDKYPFDQDRNNLGLMYGFDKGVLKDNKEIYSIIQANKTVGGFVKKYLEQLDTLKQYKTGVQKAKVMMKFNEFDTAMLFRYNLSMHLLLIYLLGGKFQEKGISVFNDIEAIIAPSIMDME